MTTATRRSRAALGESRLRNIDRRAFVDQNRRVQNLGHAFQTRGQIHHRSEDRDFHLVDGADLARHGAAGGDADADAKVGQRIVDALCRGGEFGANGQRRQAGAHRGVGLGQRPAPKTHRRVAVKIAQHAPLLANLVRRDAQRLADAIEQSQQILARALRVPRKAAQIAKQHARLPFRAARARLRGSTPCSASSTTGEKNWLSPARCRSSIRTSRSAPSVVAASSVNFRSSRRSLGSETLGRRGAVVR